MATAGALPSFPDDNAKQEYYEALNKTLAALEQRGNQGVNLWNVAGQFFNPGRTGQFGEALGNVATSVGKDVEKQQEAALPIAQMRAQIAGQRYTIQAEDAAFRMLADNLGMSQSELSQGMQSGFNQPQLKRMMQLYPMIEKTSPTVGKMVNNMIDQAIKAGDLDIKSGEFRGKYDPNFRPFGETAPSAPSPSVVPSAPSSTAPTSAKPAGEGDVYRFENLSPAAKDKLNNYARDLGLKGDTMSRTDAAELFNSQPLEKRREAFIKSGETPIVSQAPKTEVSAPSTTVNAPSNISPRKPGETLDAYNARIKKESETELAVSQKSVEAREAAPQKRFDVIASYDADTVGNTNNKLDYLYKQANTPMGKKVLSLMNKQDYMTAIGEAAESGIQTPVGSLSLPYQAFIKKVKLNPEEQAYARLIDQTISELNQTVMKEGKAIFGPQISVYDAQKMAEPGFKNTDPPAVISTLVNKFKIMNHFQGELNKAQQDYFERNPSAKTSQFFRSPEYKDVAKQYVETMKKLNQLSPF